LSFLQKADAQYRPIDALNQTAVSHELPFAKHPSTGSFMRTSIRESSRSGGNTKPSFSDDRRMGASEHEDAFPSINRQGYANL
jgi:hypothetical protein